MANSYLPASDVSNLDQVAQKVPQDAPVSLPPALDHRTTVPVPPKGALGSEDATAMLIQRVRAFLLPAVYITNLAVVEQAIEQITNCATRGAHPDGLHYKVEVLDYLQGRALKLAVTE